VGHATAPIDENAYLAIEFRRKPRDEARKFRDDDAPGRDPAAVDALQRGLLAVLEPLRVSVDLWYRLPLL